MLRHTGRRCRWTPVHRNEWQAVCRLSRNATHPEYRGERVSSDGVHAILAHVIRPSNDKQQTDDPERKCEYRARPLNDVHLVGPPGRKAGISEDGMRFSPRLRLSSESLSIAESAEVPMKLGLSVSSQLRQQLQVPHYPEKLSLLARSETTQNPGLAVKLNQELPSHLFCHRNVPAECFDAATSLPYPYPFVSDAQDFGHSNGERRGAILFSKRFEQKQLFIEGARRMTALALLRSQVSGRLLSPQVRSTGRTSPEIPRGGRRPCSNRPLEHSL
jgi:hypothetical protein